MDLSPDPSPVPSRHGRRTLIALLILALILLPLYLWPLRVGFGGLPGVSALTGWPKDPRNPAAVATIPSDVWEALMGGAADRPKATPKVAPKPRNLTMIAEAFDVGAGGSQFSGLTIGLNSPMDLTGPTDPTGSKSDDDGSSPAPVQFTSEPANRAPANGSGWPRADGFPGSGAGPFGSGAGTSTPIVIVDPGDLSPPVATPEPATILLVGSNLALASAMAWKRRRRRREEETSIG